MKCTSDDHADHALPRRADGDRMAGARLRLPRHMVVPGPDNTSASRASFENGLVMVGSAREDGFPVKAAVAGGALTPDAYVIVRTWTAPIARQGGRRKILRDCRTRSTARANSAFDPEGQLWNFGSYDPFAAET